MYFFGIISLKLFVSKSNSAHFTEKPTPSTAALTMVREMVRFGWTDSHVLMEPTLLLTAPVGHGVCMIVITLKTLLSVVQYQPMEVNVNSYCKKESYVNELQFHSFSIHIFLLGRYREPYNNPSQNSVLLVVTMHPEGKWKFSTMGRGAAFVVVTLISMRLLWCVGH